MLNHTWKDHYVALEMRAEQLERAGLQRELRSIGIETGRIATLASRMVTLGQRLQVWGCRLQSRYEAILYRERSAAMGTHLVLAEGCSIQRKC